MLRPACELLLLVPILERLQGNSVGTGESLLERTECSLPFAAADVLAGKAAAACRRREDVEEMLPQSCKVF